MRSTVVVMGCLGAWAIAAGVGCGSEGGGEDRGFDCTTSAMDHGALTTCVAFGSNAEGSYSCAPIAGTLSVHSAGGAADARPVSGACPTGTVPVPRPEGPSNTGADDAKASDSVSTGGQTSDGETEGGETSDGPSGSPEPPVTSDSGHGGGATPAGGFECTSGGGATTCVSADCESGFKPSTCGTCVPDDGPTECSFDGGGCTRTQGYWKNHAAAWPVSSLDLGGVTYTKAELLRVLKTPTLGDASMILAHQLIAALLNRASGSGASTILGTIKEAQAWMSANAAGGKLPFAITTSSVAGAKAVSLAHRLDLYNNGKIGVPHCG